MLVDLDLYFKSGFGQFRISSDFLEKPAFFLTFFLTFEIRKIQNYCYLLFIKKINFRNYSYYHWYIFSAAILLIVPKVLWMVNEGNITKRLKKSLTEGQRSRLSEEGDRLMSIALSFIENAPKMNRAHIIYRMLEFLYTALDIAIPAIFVFFIEKRFIKLGYTFFIKHKDYLVLIQEVFPPSATCYYWIETRNGEENGLASCALTLSHIHAQCFKILSVNYAIFLVIAILYCTSHLMFCIICFCKNHLAYNISISLHDYKKEVVKHLSMGELFFLGLISKSIPASVMKNFIIELVRLKKETTYPMQLVETEL
jgi:hypothetical protein